uniref:Uncharacterized protein n=1 Tax=Cannabis sativa TaxID=3483 RepID=A0A803QTT2_CANSA
MGFKVKGFWVSLNSLMGSFGVSPRMGFEGLSGGETATIQTSTPEWKWRKKDWSECWVGFWR